MERHDPQNTDRKPHAHLILDPSHKQFLTSRAPSSFSSLLLSPQRASASHCLLGFSSAAPYCCLPFYSWQCPANRTPISHSSLAHSITGYPKKKKKKNPDNLYSEPCLRCKAGEGEEQVLLKSPFEEGLKSARIEPAVWEHLFTSLGFVLQEGRFNLDSTWRRCTQVRVN